MTMQRAADSRWAINGTFFAVQKMSKRDISERVDVSNTEFFPGNDGIAVGGLSGLGEAAVGGGDKGQSVIPDIARMEIRLTNASYDPLLNPQAAPFLIRRGLWVVVSYWPAGVLNPGCGPWNMMVEECSLEGEVGRGGLPFSCVLVSDGELSFSVGAGGNG